jgi:hypothetical protein
VARSRASRLMASFIISAKFGISTSHQYRAVACSILHGARLADIRHFRQIHLARQVQPSHTFPAPTRRRSQAITSRLPPRMERIDTEVVAIAPCMMRHRHRLCTRRHCTASVQPYSRARRGKSARNAATDYSSYGETRSCPPFLCRTSGACTFDELRRRQVSCGRAAARSRRKTIHRLGIQRVRTSSPSAGKHEARRRVSSGTRRDNVPTGDDRTAKCAIVIEKRRRRIPMDDSGSRTRSSEDGLAARWTRQQPPSVSGPEDEIIYLHLPSPTRPGETYIFPLALCPSPPAEKRRQSGQTRQH